MKIWYMKDYVVKCLLEVFAEFYFTCLFIDCTVQRATLVIE